MFWVPIAAWGAAGVLALVVLGFCAFEIVWKTQRLQRDVDRLQRLADQLTTLRGELTAAQERIASTGLR